VSLNTQLRAIDSKNAQSADAHVLEIMRRADATLRDSGILDRALKAGDRAPEFAVQDTSNRLVTLTGLLSQGPVVLSFYRGDWCPYCATELNALAKVSAGIKRLGARLIAISPQTRRRRRVKSRNAMQSFPLLSDVGSVVAKAFGLAFPLAEELRPLYQEQGYPQPGENGPDDWLLPIPATYVIDRNRQIVLSYLDIDFTTRLEPAEILTALKSLRDHASTRRNP
jgi:peroxiredoxin